MEPRVALQLVDQAVASLSVTRETHQKLSEALQVLAKCVVDCEGSQSEQDQEKN